jgi:hypothetical protein
VFPYKLPKAFVPKVVPPKEKPVPVAPPAAKEKPVKRDPYFDPDPSLIVEPVPKSYNLPSVKADDDAGLVELLEEVGLAMEHDGNFGIYNPINDLRKRYNLTDQEMQAISAGGSLIANYVVGVSGYNAGDVLNGLLKSLRIEKAIEKINQKYIGELALWAFLGLEE